MDLCLYGRDNGLSPALVAAALALPPDVVAAAYRDIDTKRSAARYLHAGALTVDDAIAPARQSRAA